LSECRPSLDAGKVLHVQEIKTLVLIATSPLAVAALPAAMN
jgi:hypothetical protein